MPEPIYPCPRCNAPDWTQVRQEVVRHVPHCLNCGYSPAELNLTTHNYKELLLELSAEEITLRGEAERAAQVYLKLKTSQFKKKLDAVEQAHSLAARRLDVVAGLAVTIAGLPSGTLNLIVPELDLAYQFSWKDSQPVEGLPVTL